MRGTLSLLPNSGAALCLPDERMRFEHGVSRDQPHVFDGALRKKQAVEGVSRPRLRIHIDDGVPMIDGKQTHSERDVKVGKTLKRECRIELAEPRLDRDFPKAARACEERMPGRGEHAPDRALERA